MSSLTSYLPYLMSAATMLKSGPKMPKMKRSPTTDDAALMKAKKRSIAEQQARSGRLSTILSQRDDTLGS
jgi:hypothetical protein